jgi:glutamate racemase
MLRRLAILDWGIGGLSVLKELKAQLGDVPVLYFSDTGATPYGRMTRAELVARLHTVMAWLQAQGVTHLIIGCNAASTAIPHLQVGDLRIEGVIESAVRMTAKLKPARLALIGGRRTVVSGVYRQAFAAQGLDVTQRIAQPLSALIEKGDISSDTLRAECRRILAPIKDCSHLLLACTHYPAVAPVLSEWLSDDCQLLNPAGALIERAQRWRLPVGGADVFVTTGDAPQMRLSARLAFGMRLGKVSRVMID